MQNLSDVITSIYRSEVHKVYRYFYVRLLDRAAAEDLTSECFFRLLKKLENAELSSELETVKYLYGIVHFVFTDHLKQKYRFRFVELDEEILLAEAAAIAEEDSQNVSDLLQERLVELLPLLPEKQFTVLNLRLVEKFALEEIAKKLNKDMNYVKTTQKRGIKNLKKLLACTPISI